MIARIALGLALLLATPLFAQDSELDAAQRQRLADAEALAAQVEEDLGRTREVLARTSQIDDPCKVQYSYVDAALRGLAITRQRLARSHKATAGLPASHAGVAHLTQRSTEFAAELDAQESKIRALREALDALRDPARYPELDADLSRLARLAAAQPPEMLRGPADLAVEALGQWPHAARFASELATRYRPIMIQATPEGTRAVEALKRYHADQRALLNAALAFFDAGARQAKEQIDRALSLATQAAAEKRPGPFRTTVAEALDAARERMRVLSALTEQHALLAELVGDNAQARAFLTAGRTSVATLVEQLTEVEKRVARRAKALADPIAAAGTLPADRYAGDDRAALEEALRAAWRAALPERELLAIRLTGRWVRHARPWWDGERSRWTERDRTTVSAVLAVRLDERYAALHRATLVREAGGPIQVELAPWTAPPPQQHLPVEAARQ